MLNSFCRPWEKAENPKYILTKQALKNSDSNSISKVRLIPSHSSSVPRKESEPVLYPIASNPKKENVALRRNGMGLYEIACTQFNACKITSIMEANNFREQSDLGQLC